MKVIRSLLFGVAISAFVFLSIPTRSFKPFERVTCIEVLDRKHGGRDGRTVIHDPVQIRSICTIANRYPDGWGGPGDVFGVPVPETVAEFYRGEEFLGSFGVGPDFFETQRDGDFASRAASGREVQAFLTALYSRR